jgi:outer membrane lipoprotein-sorting protein
MNRQTPSDEFESAILSHYDRCRAESPNVRSAILDAWESQPRATPPRRFSWGSRVLGTVAVLLMVAAGLSVWESRSAPELFGADDLPERLVKVDNFRMSGWQIVAAPPDSGQEDTRLPVEFIVERPGRFRHTFHGISENGKQQTIITGMRICDGHTEMMIQQTMSGYMQVPVHPLDAALKTEEIAQGLVLAMVIGPPDLRYHPEGKAPVKGIPCDLYVGSLGEDTRIEMWLNPRTGWPERVVHSRKGQKGNWVHVMEIDEVAVNSQLPESTFTFIPPKGYVDLMAKHRPPAKDGDPQSLDQPAATLTMQENSSAHSQDQSLAVWHCFRLESESALIIWKRTAPAPDANGDRDWLHGLTLEYRSGEPARPLVQAWATPPEPEQWLWSIVRAADGKPLGRGTIGMELRGDRFQLKNGLIPLEFPDQTLEKLIEEAGKLTWKKGAATPSLRNLRDQAAKMKPEKSRD